MKQFHILIGGTYFLEDRVAFFNNKEFDSVSKSLIIDKVKWDCVDKCKQIDIKGDVVFIFGLKRWVRRLLKKRYNINKVRDKIYNFIEKNVGSSVPIGVLDDLDVRSANQFGRPICNKIIKNLNCKLVLLREYLEGKEYHELFCPFDMCSIDRPQYIKNIDDKKTDIYFRGNDSSKERKTIINGLLKNEKIVSQLKVYKGGAKSKNKTSYEKFFKELSSSKIGLNVKGNGYSCYRYHEISSVGSIIATPKYPLVIKNDYEHMKSCIKFKNVNHLRNEMNKVLSSKDYLEEMTFNSIENFKEHHTTEKRFIEFMNHLYNIGA